MRPTLRLTSVLAGACLCALMACSSSEPGGGTGGATGATGGSTGSTGGSTGTGGGATGGHAGAAGGGGAGGQAGAGGVSGLAGHGGAAAGGAGGAAGHGGAGGVAGAGGHAGAGGMAGAGGHAGAGGQGGGVAAATDCTPGCAANQVCVGTGTLGGAVLLADAGTCPAGRHLQGNICVQDLSYTCQPIPDGCAGGQVTCACASSTLCSLAGHTCATPSPGELTCVLLAP